MTTNRRGISLLLLVLAWCSPALAELPQPEVVDDQWYAVLMGGQPVGWSNMKTVREDQHYISTQDMSLTIRRGRAQVTIEVNTRFVETLEHKPIEMIATQTMGAMAIERRLEFDENAWKLHITQGGQTNTSAVAKPRQSWTTPVETAEYIEQQIAEDAREIVTHTIDVSMGTSPITTTMRFQREENVEVFGKAVPARTWMTTVSAVPGMQMPIHTDEQGRVLRMEMPIFPGMPLVMVLAEEELAKAKVNPPELMSQTVVPLDEPIKDARQTTFAMYDVSIAPAEDEGHAPELMLARTGSQRVVWANDRKARVIVDVSHSNEPGADLPTDAHLASTAMVRHDDPAVRQLVDEAKQRAGDEPTDADLSETMRRVVHDHINAKDLSVGYAAASEVARTRQGDCTEHAVLLAAMLRAVELPSRVASGVVYVDEFAGRKHVFGYHMWTQVYLNGRWIDVDATLHHRPFDATHIAMRTSDLGKDSVADLMSLAPMIGRVQIQPIEWESD